MMVKLVPRSTEILSLCIFFDGKRGDDILPQDSIIVDQGGRALSSGVAAVLPEVEAAEVDVSSQSSSLGSRRPK